MFRFILFCSVCFMSVWSEAQNITLEKEVLKKMERDTMYTDSPSLIESLNDTDRLKNELKRDLAEKENKQGVGGEAVRKKTVEFGNMNINISEREELEESKDKKKALVN